MVVVKALGGEEIKLAAGTQFQLPDEGEVDLHASDTHNLATLPAGTRIVYTNGATMTRSEPCKVSTVSKTDSLSS